MNDMRIFENEEFGNIRTMMINNEPWFVGKDVAEILGYKDSVNALKRHVDKEDKGVAKQHTLGGDQNLTIINESGLYSLILSSKLPSAKKFKHWVTSEVLPALRKTGTYTMAPVKQRILDSNDYIRASQIVASCRSGRLPIVLYLLKQGGFNLPENINVDAPEIPEMEKTTIMEFGRDYFVGRNISEAACEYRKKTGEDITIDEFAETVRCTFGLTIVIQTNPGSRRRLRVFQIEEIGEEEETC